MNRAVLMSIVAVGAVGLGCSSAAAPTEEQLGQVTETLIGGTTHTGDPAVGMMTADHGNWSSSCTATLIAPNVVATAAHCVEDVDASTTTRWETSVTPRTVPASQWHKAKSVHVHPLWGTNYINYGHDCAILVMEQPVAGVTPKPFGRFPMTTSHVGQALRVVGYGDTDGYAHTGSGTKRQITTTVKGVYDGVLSLGQQGNTSCQGDSGGPAFMTVNGVETMVGISSYGEQNCVGEGKYSRTELCAAWFDTFLGPSSCTPSCGSHTCGDDGCGGSCGTCEGGETCNDGTCGAAPADGCGVGQEKEPNDTTATANGWCTGNQIKGRLSSTSDVDYVTFQVQPNSIYDVRLTGGASGDNITLYKVSGSSMYSIGDGESDGNGGLRVWRSTATGGTYFLKVSGGANPANLYTASVTIN